MKKVLLVTAVLGLSTLGLAGCAKDGDNDNTPVNADRGVTQNTQTADSKAKDTQDAQFLREAFQGGMAEVNLGKLAARKAQDPQVKAFGQMMVKDHSAANTELEATAKELGINLPTNVTAEQEKHYSDLADLSGEEFDAKYVEMMLEDHRKDVAVFQKQTTGAENEAVKTFAKETLPTLKSH